MRNRNGYSNRKRYSGELHNEDIEKVFQAEEMLELPLVWNKVQDQIMDAGDMISEDLRPEKRKRDEVARGRRKRRNE